MPTTISGNTGVSQVQAGSITAADLDGAQTGSAPIYGCRAWVNFDGTKDTTGATSTANTNRLILGSGNVASVLRNALGNYTVTFTTAMPDANYAVTASCSGALNTNVNGVETGTLATGSVSLFLNNQSGALDLAAVSVAIFR
jgi:hypothetical protein